MSKIVARTLDFLELFADQKRPLSLSDISRLLDIPVSSCHDVLQALIERGYIYEVSPRGGYYPTLRLHGVAQAIAENDPVPLRAEPLLRALRDELEESVLLAQVSGLQATYLLTFEPAHPLRFQQKVGNRLTSLHATSGGKALLGTLDDHTLAEVLKAAKLPAFTRHTIASKAALRKQIEVGRGLGYHVNQEESVDGVTTVSATFTWHVLLYIVTVAGPTARLAPKLDRAGRSLLEVCRALDMRSASPAEHRRLGPTPARPIPA
jgi:DNA-binding IclR family transcriptional regulator